MSASLEAALDNLTDRAAVIGALSTSTSPKLGALNRAVAIELAMCELREQETLRQLASSQVLLGDVTPPSGPDDAPYWPAVPGDD